MSEGENRDALSRLGAEIDRARSADSARQATRTEGDGNLQQGMGQGFRIGIEFVVTIGVATGLGWAVDRWLGTAPWGIIILFFLGIGAGMVNVYRAVAGIKTAVGFRPVPPRAKGDWDDEE